VKLRRAVQYFGLSLLVAAFGLGMLRLFHVGGLGGDAGAHTLRIGHYQLESGAREALAAVIGEYEALHPGRKVVQTAIPERVFPSWLRTQLVGGTPPDIIQLGRESGSFEDIYANYFEPIGSWLRQPNPYNAKTYDAESPLEDVPWINTFVDGLERGASYSGALMEHYGVPSTLFTTRVFYNRALLEEVQGDAPMPREFSEFVALCARIEAFAREQNRLIVPIAGSKVNAPPLLQALFESQTQALFLNVDPLPMLRVSFFEFHGMNALRGRWNLESPQLHAAFSAMREVGRHMSPGALQLERDDSLFLFSQGRAAFLVTGSQDARSLAEQCAFPLGVFAIPYPSPDDEKYGRFATGDVSEGAVTTQFVLGLTRDSRKKEEAIDFLRFLTSRRMNKLFAETARWLPVVVSVEPSDELAAFSPELEGYPPGPYFLAPGPSTGFLLQTNLHTLLQTSGSVEAFLDAVRPGFEPAIRADVMRIHQGNVRMTARVDSVLGARYWLGLRQGGERDRRHVLVTQIQATRELRKHRIDYELSILAAGAAEGAK